MKRNISCINSESFCRIKNMLDSTLHSGRIFAHWISLNFAGIAQGVVTEGIVKTTGSHPLWHYDNGCTHNRLRLNGIFPQRTKIGMKVVHSTL